MVKYPVPSKLHNWQKITNRQQVDQERKSYSKLLFGISPCKPCTAEACPNDSGSGSHTIELLEEDLGHWIVCDS